MGHGLGIETQADNEIDDDSHADEEHAAGHALAIEDKEEGQIDQRRTRFTLQDDEQNGQHDNGDGFDEMARIGEVETIGTHILGQGQRCGTLGELGRLDADGPEVYPGVTALGAGGNEWGDEQYAHHDHIDHVGKGVVDAVVSKHNDQPKYKRADYPRKLFPRTRCKIKKIGITIVIAGSDHTDPSRSNEQKIDNNRYHVDGAQEALLSVSVVLYHNRWFLKQKPPPVSPRWARDGRSGIVLS